MNKSFNSIFTLRNLTSEQMHGLFGMTMCLIVALLINTVLDVLPMVSAMNKSQVIPGSMVSAKRTQIYNDWLSG